MTEPPTDPAPTDPAPTDPVLADPAPTDTLPFTPEAPSEFADIDLDAAGPASALSRLAEPPYKVPETLTELRHFLQAALTLEHLTIPPYMTAMYTLTPGANREAHFAIRGVVLEEMLHMALVGNLLNAVGGTPKVAGSSFIRNYPARLPYARDDVPVALWHFSPWALLTFLFIERPEYVAEPPRAGSGGSTGSGWTSIGQFYATLRQGLTGLVDKLGEAKVFSGAGERQVGPEDFYNSGGEIFEVDDLETALKALTCISDQGEGVSHTIWNADDRLFGETRQPAHYFRFNEILWQRRYGPHDTPKSSPSGPTLPVDWSAAYAIDPRARVADFRGDAAVHQAARDFNLCYATLLVALERAFQEHPGWMRTTIPLMLRLRDLSQRLYRNPHPDPAKRARGLHASATFEVTDETLRRARAELARAPGVAALPEGLVP
ncbi:ferritin-like protein [Streptomyces sp. LX-29]|uniref:ferritin-like domain-containing protein n=1 Tax=Streptomyces sp. LX-29 TaxID=2900152 RepID=UPI00240E3FEC|nr:ferritin-like protein [Streptomyces sp. LX-29]WFB10074.1 ferritin-like protein [Streptomyces sp. LX-29]